MLTREQIKQKREDMESVQLFLQAHNLDNPLHRRDVAIVDAAEMYLVALWAMRMPCEDCPMRQGCMTSAALCGGIFCRQGFEPLAEEWRELWRKMG